MAGRAAPSAPSRLGPILYPDLHWSLTAPSPGALYRGEEETNQRPQIVSYRCFDGYGFTDPELQRLAIARFDELLANHPTLGKNEEE